LTEFVVSAKLIADASAMKKGAGEGADALRDVGKAADQAATGNANLSRSSDLAVAQMRRVTVSAGQQRAGMQQLSYQIGDVSQQLALGVNPAVVFGQQIGQVIQAIQLMRGSSSGLVNFLAGPWGAVLTGAVTVAGLLAAKLFEGDKASKSSTKSALDYADALSKQKYGTQEAMKALRELNDEKSRSRKNDILAAEEAVTLANAQLSVAMALRERIRARLEQFNLETNQLQRTDAGETFGNPVNTQALLIQAKIDAETAKIEAARTTIRQNTIDLAQAAAKAAVDPLVKINQEYDRLTSLAIKAAENNDRLNASLSRTLIGIEKNRKAALDAQREMDKASRATGGTSDIPTVSQLSRILREEFPGTRITDGLRSKNAGYGAKNSFHKIGQAVDFVPGGGMGSITKDQIRKALEGRGVMIAELLGPGDKGHSNHFHIAVTKGATALQGFIDAERDAAKASEELNSALDRIVNKFDPAAKAAAEYRAQLADIAVLEASKRITPDQAANYRKQVVLSDIDAREKAAQKAIDNIQEQIGAPASLDPWIDGMADAGRAGARAFRDEGLEAAQAIAQVLGGKVGGSVASLLGLITGAQSGNFNSVGGRAGGILTLLGAQSSNRQMTLPDGSTRPMQGISQNLVFDGLQEVFEPLRRSLKEMIRDISGIFGDQGAFTKALGKAAGFSVIGSAAAKATGGSGLGGAIGGAVGGFAGEAAKGLLGSLGGLAGPLGSVLGGVLGGVLGKAIAGTKRGSATITGVDSDISTRGNSAGFQSQAKGVAGGIQDALSNIAEQLGGQLGSFAVSIGLRDGKYRVDPTGSGITKTRNGAVDFGKEGEADAIAYAIQDAIADGAITGLSAAVQKAIKSSSNVDKALREALKVQEIEDILAGFTTGAAKAFRDFERQAAERVKIATKYGFDVVKIEELNAKERLKLEQDMLDQRIGSLRDLLTDLDMGDLFEGSVTDRLAKIRTELAKAEEDAKAGVDGAADRQAQLSRELLSLSREAFGTAGGEYANDLASARTGAEKVIELEIQRQKEAAEAAKQTNASLEENNSQNAEMITRLANIEQILASLNGGYGFSLADTTRLAGLT
jgi:hypothetical protein